MLSTRRNFLQKSVGAASLTALALNSGCRSMYAPRFKARPNMSSFAAPPLEVVRIGIIGVGHRGSAAVKRLCQIPGVQITAISDLHEEKVRKAEQSLPQGKYPPPQLFYGAPDMWQALCNLEQVDLVYICTPWLLHAPMAIYAMQHNKHAAVEVPAAMTVEQCWQLVDTAEATQRHCMLLENCCYGENELFAMMLCRKGVLGELVHGEAAYIHDLRYALINQNHAPQDSWRLNWSQQHTGNSYPTHGLGPICQYMDINRGDKMEYLSSISSAQFGLSLTAEKVKSGYPVEKSAYKQGDMSTTIIRTFRGRTIMLQHDTTSPRPYTRHNMISGTRGILADFPLRVALDPVAAKWMPESELAKLKQRHKHPLWQALEEKAKKDGGHGGMDYIMDWRLCHCLQKGLPLDISVYDTALWSCLVELSERSVLGKGKSIAIPDFTRGRWKSALPLPLAEI